MLFDNFTDTVFLKEDSEMQKELDALIKLKEEFPDNTWIDRQIYMKQKGLEGEKEIRYQLSKANLGLYVLHDVKFSYKGLTAQVDYIIFSKAYVYFVECKNIVGKITVNNKGEFIRESKYGKKGMPSPIRQVEAQLEVYRKIWNDNVSFLTKLLGSKNFYNFHRTLVVAANNETILNTNYAPKDIKYRVIKADGLVRQLKYDLEHSDREIWSSRKELEDWAVSFLKHSSNRDKNYYREYRDRIIKYNNR